MDKESWLTFSLRKSVRKILGCSNGPAEKMNGNLPPVDELHRTHKTEGFREACDTRVCKYCDLLCTVRWIARKRMPWYCCFFFSYQAGNNAVDNIGVHICLFMIVCRIQYSFVVYSRNSSCYNTQCLYTHTVFYCISIFYYIAIIIL